MTEQQNNPPPPTVDPSGMYEIADGVWIIPDHRVPLVPNIGIVLGNHSALVVDTGMGSKNGQAVLDAARRLAGTRELFLTLTHFHPEHGYGAEPFKGEAEILYNGEQARELADKGEAYLDMFKAMGPSIALALDGTRLVEADTLYDGTSHELDLGGRSVILRTWGKAHTRGDQIVYLPDDGILFTGDLAEEKTFPIFPWFPPHDTDIDARNWIAALDDCLTLQPSIVVPGHGEVGGPEIISGVHNYIASLGDRVLAARRSGKTADQIVAELGPQIRGEHPDWHFPEWIDFAIRYHASLA